MTPFNGRLHWLWFSAALASTWTAWTRVRADEGMWTFDNPPLAALRERYGFTSPAGWLDHLRLASVRFNDGGSGSFISASGLVMTNHHVGPGQLHKISTPGSLGTAVENETGATEVAPASARSPYQNDSLAPIRI